MSSTSPDFDVAILGAGFAGAATAWALARRAPGLRIALLEQAPELGQFASGRSAGMGRQLAEDDETTALTVDGAAALRRHGTGAFWHEHGGVLTFDDDAHLRRTVQRAAAFQLPCRALAAAELAALGVHAAHGLWVPSDGLIEVLPLLRWLVTEAQQRGAQLLLDTAVTALEEQDGGARLHTSRGALRSRLLVEATGAWAGQLTGRSFTALRRHVYAVPGPRAAPAPRPAEPTALSARGPFVWHLGSTEVYLRPRADDSWLVSPCDERPGAPGDQRLDADAEPELTRRLRDFAPGWAGGDEGPALLQRWSCQRTFSPTRRMVLERDAQRPYLFWAAGLGGHGATAACAVGERVAAQVAAALQQR